MTRGRPPNWNPFGDVIPSAWTEAVQVGSKARITLPAAVRGRLDWFGADDRLDLLAILDPQGRVELTPWIPRGVQARADVSDRIEAAPVGDRAALAIAAMDRYMRLSAEPPARVGLPANLASHLEAVENGVVRAVVMDGRLWLWSERQWQARRMDRIGLLTTGD